LLQLLNKVIIKIILGVIGGAFALAANIITFTIIDQINQKVSNNERIDWVHWGSGIRKQNRRLYPGSRLVLAMDACAALMVSTFLILGWATFR
jgi:hypothetical protein